MSSTVIRADLLCGDIPTANAFGCFIDTVLGPQAT